MYIQHTDAPILIKSINLVLCYSVLFYAALVRNKAHGVGQKMRKLWFFLLLQPKLSHFWPTLYLSIAEVPRCQRHEFRALLVMGATRRLLRLMSKVIEGMTSY